MRSSRRKGLTVWLAAQVLVGVGCTDLSQLTGGGSQPISAAPNDEAPVDDSVDDSDGGMAAPDSGQDQTRDTGSDVAPYTGEGAGTCNGPSIYASVVLGDLPLAYWKLNETTGTTFADATGHGYDAAITGAVTLGQSCSGVRGYNGAHFAGGSAGATVAKKDTLARDNLTLEIWLKVPTAENWPSVFGRDSWSYDYGFGLTATNWNGAGGQYPVFGHYGVCTCGAQSSQSITDNKWHHVVGVMEKIGASYNYRLYMDGASVASSTGTTGVNASAAGTMVMGLGGSFGYTGDIAHIALYDRALSPATIVAHYQAR